MSTSIQALSQAFTIDRSGVEQPRSPDFAWAPRHAIVGMAKDENDTRSVCHLRHQVYVHEQGIPVHGIDAAQGELVDPLDPCSGLWYAKNDATVVGTVTQTMIGPNFDLSRLPAELELDRFPRATNCILGYSSRFAIAPYNRSSWVLPSLVRYSYAHARSLACKFGFMVTNPALVPLFERLGYLRYTETTYAHEKVGLLIPMVLPATDHEHLSEVRSACLPAAMHLAAEPEWGAWLRAKFPIIGVYYGSDRRHAAHGVALARQIDLPVDVAVELSLMSFAHHFPAGTSLRREGDRVMYSFFAVEGQIRVDRACSDASSRCFAPDGVEFSRAAIRCETDAVVLCIPDAAVLRLQRRYPEYILELHRLLKQNTTVGRAHEKILR